MQRIKGNSDKKTPSIFCVFAFNKDAFQGFLDAFKNEKSKSFNFSERLGKFCEIQNFIINCSY
jgi:hypothetical protein